MTTVAFAELVGTVVLDDIEFEIELLVDLAEVLV